jgi:hypothetical protein
MQIRLTFHIPEEELKTLLEKEGMTREGFKEHARTEFEQLGEELQTICPTTTQIEITD